MNCKQLNSIGLEEVLAFLGHLPTRQNEKETWYYSPFGYESHASFKVDKPKNLWYLFSEGAGGTTTDFIQKYLDTSIKGALEWASQHDFFFFSPARKRPKPELNYHIDMIKDIQNPNLMQYLHERGLSAKVYPLIKEIWFTIGSKKLYAIGFKNRMDGWELRNAFYKGALNRKDIAVLSFPLETNNSTTERQNQKVAVFEGFMDALSFAQMQKDYNGDLLVLNSIALLKMAIEELSKYSEISLFLDNDKAGKNCTAKIKDAYPYAKDFSHIYSHYKDLNQYLMEKRKHQYLATAKESDMQKPKTDDVEKQASTIKETNKIMKRQRRM